MKQKSILFLSSSLLSLSLFVMLFSFGCATSDGKNNKRAYGNNVSQDTSVASGFSKQWGRIDELTAKDGLGKKNAKAYYLYGAEELQLENYYFDIPVVYNAAVKKWMNYFLQRGRGYFENYVARAGRYAPLMGKILQDSEMPEDLIFLAMAESGFQNKAKSHASAVGPWQFMSYTGKRYGLSIDWYIDERRDPIKATIAASKYLKKLYDDFGCWEIAAAAYNAGEGKLSRAINKYNTDNFWDLREKRYLKAETKNYVPKIMALAIIGKNLKSFGFEDLMIHEPLDFDEIDVSGDTDLIALSNLLGVDFEEIQRLNPEILRWYISPKITNYKLRVPVGFAASWDKIAMQDSVRAKDFQTIPVRYGITSIEHVAKKYKVSKEVLAELNNTSTTHKFGKGQEIILPFRVGQSARDEMYNDLYEKPRRHVLYKQNYKKRIAMASKKGNAVKKPTQFYVVKRGDSLWTVAKKTGTSIDNIVASNLNIIRNRMIREGDRLIIR